MEKLFSLKLTIESPFYNIIEGPRITGDFCCLNLCLNILLFLHFVIIFIGFNHDRIFGSKMACQGQKRHQDEGIKSENDASSSWETLRFSKGPQNLLFSADNSEDLEYFETPAPTIKRKLFFSPPPPKFDTGKPILLFFTCNTMYSIRIQF